jgi:hypothetical protein
MVGIFRRFFGSRGRAASQSLSETVSQPAKKKDNTFFLNPDEAKTLGNIEYMRTPRTGEAHLQRLWLWRQDRGGGGGVFLEQG